MNFKQIFGFKVPFFNKKLTFMDTTGQFIQFIDTKSLIPLGKFCDNLST